MRRGIEEEQVEGDLRYRPFSEEGFIDDLRTSRAVVASGGFTLMGECVYLRKPMLSVPVGRQFEQVLNARYLEQAGYGRAAVEIDSPTLKRFLQDVPACEESLASYSQDGNADLFSALDQRLDRIAAGL